MAMHILSGQHHPQDSDRHGRIFKSEDNSGLTQINSVCKAAMHHEHACTSLSDRSITYHRQPHAVANRTKTIRDDITV